MFRTVTDSVIRLENRWSALVTWALVLSPFVLLIDILVLALHVRLALGHWPKPMAESYSSPAFNLHTELVVCFGMFTAWGAIPLWLLFLCFRRFRFSRRMHLFQAGMFVVGWVCVIGYLVWDPQRFVTWFLD